MKNGEWLIKKEIKKIKSTHVAICSICFLIAFATTVQIRTTSISKSDILRLKNENELRDEITQWEEKYEVSQTTIIELKKKIEEYRNEYSSNDDKIALIKSELDDANILAGNVAVKGPGIEVVLDDTAEIERIAFESGMFDSNVYIIHDTDLMSVVNELLAAGAEAVDINGQRIVSTTAIRCVGPLIQINGINYSAPFKISAIGDPDTLKGALNLRGGIISEIKGARIDVTIEKKDEITIQAYEKVVDYKYATPVEEGDR